MIMELNDNSFRIDDKVVVKNTCAGSDNSIIHGIVTGHEVTRQWSKTRIYCCDFGFEFLVDDEYITLAWKEHYE